jgi:hypothetical protein
VLDSLDRTAEFGSHVRRVLEHRPGLQSVRTRFAGGEE